jgi:hypothetical protein
MVLRITVYQKDGGGVYWTLDPCRGSFSRWDQPVGQAGKEAQYPGLAITSLPRTLENRSDKCYKMSLPR